MIVYAMYRFGSVQAMWTCHSEGPGFCCFDLASPLSSAGRPGGRLRKQHGSPANIPVCNSEPHEIAFKGANPVGGFHRNGRKDQGFTE